MTPRNAARTPRCNLKWNGASGAKSAGFVLALLLFFVATFSQAQSAKQDARLAKGEHSANVNGVKFWYAVRGAGPLLIAPESRIQMNLLERSRNLPAIRND